MVFSYYLPGRLMMIRGCNIIVLFDPMICLCAFNFEMKLAEERKRCEFIYCRFFFLPRNSSSSPRWHLLHSHRSYWRVIQNYISDTDGLHSNEEKKTKWFSIEIMMMIPLHPSTYNRHQRSCCFVCPICPISETSKQ